jgi:hypothetical protein
MIRVFINHNLVAIPKPVIRVSIVKWRNTEGRTGNPEALPISTLNPKEMAWAKAPRKTPMLKGTFHMEAGIIAVSIVTYPLAVRVDVGSVRMSFAVSKPAAFNNWLLGRFWSSAVFHTHRRRAMRRNKPAAHSGAMFVPSCVPV